MGSLILTLSFFLFSLTVLKLLDWSLSAKYQTWYKAQKGRVQVALAVLLLFLGAVVNYHASNSSVMYLLFNPQEAERRVVRSQISDQLHAVSGVINSWNRVKNILSDRDPDAIKVRDEIGTVLNHFKGIEHTKLSVSGEVFYLYNLVKLKVIYADVNRDQDDLIFLASHELQQAFKLAMSGRDGVITQADRDYIRKKRLERLMRDTEINIELFKYLVTESDRYRDSARKLLQKRGGCEEYVVVRKVHHQDLLWASGCDINILAGGL